jgi:hypothetical protein
MVETGRRGGAGPAGLGVDVEGEVGAEGGAAVAVDDGSLFEDDVAEVGGAVEGDGLVEVAAGGGVLGGGDGVEAAVEGEGEEATDESRRRRRRGASRRPR